MFAEFFTGPLSWSNQLEFGDGFFKGSKTREPAVKPLKLGKIQQQTQPTSVTPWAGIDPRLHWWEASSLMTAASLLPNVTLHN